MEPQRYFAHEAGHAVAALAMGYKVCFVMRGPIWRASERSGFVRARGYYQGLTRWMQGQDSLDNDAVKISGFVGEHVLAGTEPDLAEFRSRRSYKSDRDQMAGSDVHALSRSRAILESNREALAAMRDTLRDAGFRTVQEEDLRPVRERVTLVGRPEEADGAF